MEEIQPVLTEGRILSDKTIEIGAVLLLIAIVLHVLVTAIKIRIDQKLKSKMIEQGIAGELLAKSPIFNSNQQNKEPLKWCFLFLSLGLSFLVIQTVQELGITHSENIFLIIIFSMLSASFLAYYFVLRYQSKTNKN